MNFKKYNKVKNQNIKELMFLDNLNLQKQKYYYQ